MSLVERMLCGTVVVPLALLGAGPLQAAQRVSPEQRILELTNAARADSGCPALRPNPGLDRAAAEHSENMARENFFDHVGSDGSNPAGRAREAGFPSGYVGENIAAGENSPDAVFHLWMDNPSHRENILNCDFTDLGVARVEDPDSDYGSYWTQELGNPALRRTTHFPR